MSAGLDRVIDDRRHSTAMKRAHSPGSARRQTITNSEETQCSITVTRAIRQSVPRPRPSKGMLTLSWVSFSQDLPSCCSRPLEWCMRCLPDSGRFVPGGPAQRQRHRQVRDDLPRIVDRPRRPPPLQRGGKATVQAGGRSAWSPAARRPGTRAPSRQRTPRSWDGERYDASGKCLSNWRGMASRQALFFQFKAMPVS
jgi:hypothetical protein